MVSDRHIYFLVPYPLGKAASQRFRFEQYLSLLPSDKITVAPFMDEQTWHIYHKPGNRFKKVAGIVKGFFRRLSIVSSITKNDLVFIHREASPVGPPVFEWYLSKIKGVKIIFDFDDAIWLPNVSEANSPVGFLKYPSKTRRIIRMSKRIAVGNRYLAKYALQYSRDVIILPTTIDTSYHQPAPQTSKQKITVGWTGSETTIRHFLTALPVLKRLHERFGSAMEFLVISSRNPQVSDLPVKFIAWNTESEISDLQAIDIGIMPLPDDDWSRGKCAFKGLQYMALGLPTVMSPVGMNTDLIKHGVNGFLANNEDEWVAQISRLAENPQLRSSLGVAARETILQSYSVNANKSVFLDLFNQ